MNIDELEIKVKNLEKELKDLKEIIKKQKEINQLAQLGHWTLDLINDNLYWSEEIYQIFQIDSQEFQASYDAFLELIHPEDRNYVDDVYTDSVVNHKDYDIIHRLLLKDGTIKHVNERCKTFYDENGRPIRSIGTVQDVSSSFGHHRNI